MSDVTVRGGANGIDAKFEDLLAEADVVASAAEHVLGIALHSHGLLANPDILASAVLDPLGAARFEAALLAALDGRAGLSAVGTELEVQAVRERFAVHSYRALESALTKANESLRWTRGAVVGATLPLWILPATAVAGTYWVGDSLLGGDPGADLEVLLLNHPGLVDEIVGSAPGLLTALELPLELVGVDPVLTLQDASAQLGLMFPNGTGSARPVGPPQRVPAARDVRELLADLSTRNNDTAERVDAGGLPVIDLRKVTHLDGTVAWIVDLPGTSQWTGPGGHANPADTAGNLASMAGVASAYQQAIEKALQQAGVARNEDILLVGHSQGGMVAAQTAVDLVRQGYQAPHVLTVASPIATTAIPTSVQVLSLENSADIVPHLDGADNPASAHQLTVTFTQQYDTISANHGLGAYRTGAQAVDSSTNPSIAAWRRDLAARFLGEDATVTMMVFEVYRS